MRRHGWLWEGLTSFENLLQAARRSARGKRYKPSVLRFHDELERNLIQLQEELVTKTYRPGAYRSFKVYDPKERTISAAPYRDRVVHHALCQVLEPIYERSFYRHSYASRKDKGTHAALRRVKRMVRRYPYVLKLDVKKYFPSIDHELLKGRLRGKVKDPHVHWLVDRIIDNWDEVEPVVEWFPGDDLLTPTERRRGLPIGNQTSQFFANVYLDSVDHLVASLAEARGHVRYMDDFVIFGESRQALGRVKAEVVAGLGRLRLRPHRDKTVIFPTRCGVPFVGYRTFPDRTLLARGSVVRFGRRFRSMERKRLLGRMDEAEMRRRVSGWIGHAIHADRLSLGREMLSRLGAKLDAPGPAGRFLQQLA